MRKDIWELLGFEEHPIKEGYVLRAGTNYDTSNEVFVPFHLAEAIHSPKEAVLLIVMELEKRIKASAKEGVTKVLKAQLEALYLSRELNSSSELLNNKPIINNIHQWPNI